MPSVQALSYDCLCQDCDPEQFDFETTAELEPLSEIIGQERALEAMRFAANMRGKGYNLFAMGSSGTGKFTALQQFLIEKSAPEAVPDDWCYVNNFVQPNKPLTLRLPAGQGIILRKDIHDLVEELHTAIPSAFDDEAYKNLENSVNDEFNQLQQDAIAQLQAEAQSQGVALIRNQVGWGFAPVQDGNMITPEQFQTLPEEAQTKFRETSLALEKDLQATLQQVRDTEKDRRERLKAVNRQVTTDAVDHLIDDLRRKHRELPAVVAYLDALQDDVIDTADEFRSQEAANVAPSLEIPVPRGAQGPPSFRRYQVNVVVDNTDTEGAPVIYEDYPTYPHLFGQVELTLSRAGALVTDFNLIKSGALHRANGGYLILNAIKILQQPLAWDQLKRALSADQISIETPTQMAGWANAVSLEPEPIPLSVKVFIFGDRALYYQLYQLDPDFGELFKVVADFADQMARNPENNQKYARLIGTFGEKEGLRHFDRAAVARVIEQSARFIGHSEKLSSQMQAVADLTREASYWAEINGKEVVGVDDVQQALDSQIYRVDRARTLTQEQIEEETILIDTDGEAVGQINGLSVLSISNFSFGRPSRITARIRPGRGEVIDIEREVALGGPLHTKGVLILSSFLGTRYGQFQPLSLTASLVFEQSYGGVDGDSASSTELYALLSAIAQIPIKQSLAVTGSVNQHGLVQAIGGVNEKIEGFFDLCQARGLTGDQGVLIPNANVKHLMLRSDVIDAVRAERFHIYPIESIDQGMEVLTGLPAGERDENDIFPEGAVNRLVEDRLAALAEIWRSFNDPHRFDQTQETG